MIGFFGGWWGGGSEVATVFIEIAKNVGLGMGRLFEKGFRRGRTTLVWSRTVFLWVVWVG